MVQADKGSLSVPISGQLESKLSPNNPPIDWKHEGGPPWYRKGKRYPFVNSNFHPDFGTASVDMRRAWAALGYPEVDGVVTVDMSALASMLAWTGAVESPGFGEDQLRDARAQPSWWTPTGSSTAPRACSSGMRATRS